MSRPDWRPHLLPRPGFELAWYEAGSGPTVVFLHGGPGDNHRSMQSAAEPFVSHFRCVLYDQRGTGDSRLERLDDISLYADAFVEDLDALRIELGEERLRVAGHSWGATLALIYGVNFPEHADHMALVGLGPLDDEMSAVASANRLAHLSAEQRANYQTLSGQQRAALEAGDAEACRAIGAQRMRLSLRSAIFSPAIADAHTDEHLQDMGDLHLVSLVNQLVSRSWQKARAGIWERLKCVTAPVLILYGYQDFEPITQAYRLKEHVPQAQLCFLNQCGHIPWIEQPEAYYRAVNTFLQES